MNKSTLSPGAFIPYNNSQRKQKNAPSQAGTYTPPSDHKLTNKDHQLHNAITNPLSITNNLNKAAVPEHQDEAVAAGKAFKYPEIRSVYPGSQNGVFPLSSEEKTSEQGVQSLAKDNWKQQMDSASKIKSVSYQKYVQSPQDHIISDEIQGEQQMIVANESPMKKRLNNNVECSNETQQQIKNKSLIFQVRKIDEQKLNESFIKILNFDQLSNEEQNLAYKRFSKEKKQILSSFIDVYDKTINNLHYSQYYKEILNSISQLFFLPSQQILQTCQIKLKQLIYHESNLLSPFIDFFTNNQEQELQKLEKFYQIIAQLKSEGKIKKNLTMQGLYDNISDLPISQWERAILLHEQFEQNDK